MAAPYNPPKKNEDFILYVGLSDMGSAGSLKSNPTIAAGDFKKRWRRVCEPRDASRCHASERDRRQDRAFVNRDELRQRVHLLGGPNQPEGVG
jgi:hypothetical protein